MSALLFLSTVLTHAEVAVSEAWIRATVPNQQATGAFMDLVSKGSCKLVSASSPLTKTVEIHEMKMEGDVMKMREVKAIDLPDGKGVRLAPGGHHVMLLDLKDELKVGQKITLVLTFEMPDGKKETQNVEAEVRALATPDKAGDHAGH
jgi:copper(I)-binding protein